jgi:hypothetical protein
LSDWAAINWSAVRSVECAAVARRDRSSSVRVDRQRPNLRLQVSARTQHTKHKVHDSNIMKLRISEQADSYPG